MTGLTDVLQLRVRYSETDQMGTFYNSRALEWFECGRTELMRAVADGVYNRVPAAGQPRVITVADAVEVVAEPGRPVQRVDVRPF